MPRAASPAVHAAADAGDARAIALLAWYTPAGQGLLQALALVLDKPPTHDAVSRALDLLIRHFPAAPAAR